MSKPGLRKLLLSSGASKVAILPLNVFFSFFSMGIIIQNYGADAYAEYALLLSIAGMVPFVDLGISAVVLNALSGSDPRADARATATLVTALRALLLTMFVLVIVVTLITALRGWNLALGGALRDPFGNYAAGLCLAIFAITVPLGLGQRILIARGRNALQVVLQGLQYPTVLGVILVFVGLEVDPSSFLALAGYAGLLTVSFVSLIFAARTIKPMMRTALLSLLDFRGTPSVPIAATAWPMMVQMIAVPLITQSGRLVISHVGTPDALAEYSLAWQIFMPVWQLTGTVGIVLWPVYAAQRASGVSASPFPMALKFLAVGAPIGITAALVAPWAAKVVSGGEITLSPLLVYAFTTFVTLNWLLYPLGMFLTDTLGLRFQALCVLVSLPITLLSSYYLSELVGAPGPVIAAALSIAFAQIVPSSIYVRKVMRNNRRIQSTNKPQEDHVG